MRKIYSFTIVIIVVILISFACSSKNDQTVVELNTVLDSIKMQYAPDSRHELWDLSVTTEDNLIHLSGELTSEEAYSAIKDIASEQFTNIDIDLHLLPEGVEGRFVNGLINNSVAHMRSEPRHMADFVSEELLGTPVRILKKDGGWSLIQTPDQYLGWVDSSAAEEIDAEKLIRIKQAKKIIYNEQYGFSYTDPDVKSMPVSDLVIGCLLNVRDTKGSFYMVEYPDGRIAWVKKSEVIDVEELVDRNPEPEALLEVALKFNGVPYLWGGKSSKGIDCSGLAYFVYYMNGMVLTRDASQQVKYGKEITSVYDFEDLKAGDLLFFGRPASESSPERVTHVVIYKGDSEFIHASGSNGRVGINSMDQERKNFIPSYAKSFIRAMRIIDVEDEGYQAIRENKFYKEIL